MAISFSGQLVSGQGVNGRLGNGQRVNGRLGNGQFVSSEAEGPGDY
jgi:hypothetical protein